MKTTHKSDTAAEPISQALAIVVNLRLAADWHHDHCAEECDVSLSLLEMAARRMAGDIWWGEDEAVKKLLSTWPR